MDRTAKATEKLLTPVQFVKGVGPRRAALLAKLGLRTVADLLFFFPRDYEDLTNRRSVDELVEGQLQTVRGKVEEIDARTTGAGRSVVGILLRCEGGHLRAVWFNQPFMRERFAYGQEVLLSGKPKRDGIAWQMAHPRVSNLEGEDADAPGEPLLPVYPLTEGLRQYELRKIIRHVLPDHAALLEEAFPEAFLEEHALLPIEQALRQVHFPDSIEARGRARRRFIYQELFILELAMAVRRKQNQTGEASARLDCSTQIDARIRRLFPFELTGAQQRAIEEIRADMGRSVPMSRLLQGDVGSGKTIVAVYAMLLAIAHHHQAVLMAPTEVLARQHLRTLRHVLHESLTEGRVRIHGLLGGMPPRERAARLEKIASGEANLIVGTQAVIQQDVRFEKLGLVVIDEQHKFGVRQRAHLKGAGFSPHYLVMTATPIPRSLTMSLLGDLDVSIIDELPPGRQKTRTYLVQEDERDRWWRFFCDKLREGRQGYVVVPLVEESENFDAVSLASAYEELANGPLEAFRLGLLHGRMSSEEKEAVMADFRAGEIQVLVSTTVIEVGVDVPNATLMVIENAERFGLAQLHQLRGRIGRGRHPGLCAVFSGVATDEAKSRLAAFVKTTDGFQLAEIDFELRGPGELLGTRQHGLPPFHIADLLRDGDILREARRDAFKLVDEDPGLSDPEHARLRKQVLARYGHVLELGDVG